MERKRCLAVVLALAMVLSMACTNLVFAESKPSVAQTVQEAAPQMAPELAIAPDSIVVDPNGAVKSIGAALEAVKDGGSIVVKAGTYNEFVDIRKSVAITGEAGAKVVGGFSVYASNVSIKGMEITTLARPGYIDAAISLFPNTTGCLIEGNKINVTANCYGIITTGTQDTHTFAKNTFTGSNAEALIFTGIQPDGQDATLPPTRSQGSVNSSRNITITENIFKGTADYGVVVTSLASPITNNTFEVACDKARLTVAISGLTITGNIFAENDAMLALSKPMQFFDLSDSYDLEAVRKANTFAQAAYYVIPKYEDASYIFYKIQDAVDWAWSASWKEQLAGADILVGAGNYKENVVIRDKFFKMKSVDGNPISNSTYATICPKTGVALTIDDNDTNWWASVGYAQVEGFKINRMYADDIDGCSFINNKFDGLTTVDTKGAAYAAVVNDANSGSTKVTSFDSNIFTGAYDAGLLLTNSRNITLNRNIFEGNGFYKKTCEGTDDCKGDGARIINVYDLRVLYNTFRNNRGDGLELDRIAAAGAEMSLRTSVKQNKFDDNGLDGLKVANSNLITVEYNLSVARNGGNGMSFFNCHNVSVNNHSDELADFVGIINNGGAGVLFTYPQMVATATELSRMVDNVVINENTILNNGADGVVGIDADNVTITNNVIVGNGKSGVGDGAGNLEAAIKLTASNNEITDNATDGIEVFYAEDADIFSNDILRNGRMGIDFQVGFAEITDNLIQANGDDGISIGGEASSEIYKNWVLDNGFGKNSDNEALFAGGIDIHGDANVHYNDIVGNDNFGLNLRNGALEGTRNKFTYNYWGNASGPMDGYQRTFADAKAGVSDANLMTGNLLGDCNAIIVNSNYKKVSVSMYAPWVSKPFTTINKPGGAEPVIPFALNEGWNFISTPKILSDDFNSWATLANLGDKLDFALLLGYDPATGKWSQGTNVPSFKPQDAYFIRMNSVDMIAMVIKTDTFDSTGTVPVVRQLKEGWNLVSKADDIDNRMTVREVLASAGDPINGWQYVLHPDMDHGYGRHQDEFSFQNTSTDNKKMVTFAGYWVYMNSDKKLAGGTTSYRWDKDWDKIENNSKFLSLTDYIFNVQQVTQ